MIETVRHILQWIAELREYATNEGLTVSREFVESRTAKDPGRPIFNDLHELVTGWGLTSHREKPIARSMLP